MSPVKLAVVGDTHGNARWINDTVIPFAAQGGADTILQVGDCGFVWPEANYLNKIRKLDRSLGRAGMSMLFLPGNHEDHAKLARIEASAERTPEGHYHVTENLIYAGRYSAWEWAGRRLATVGGAVSIDREWRQRRLRQRPKRAPIWWPEEVLSPDELAAARAMGPVDVLFTHDAPSSFPMRNLKPDLESTANRQAITDVARALTPKLLIHGHYHTRLTYALNHSRGMCEVHALSCDGTSPAEGMLLLDLKGGL